MARGPKKRKLLFEALALRRDLKAGDIIYGVVMRGRIPHCSETPWKR